MLFERRHTAEAAPSMQPEPAAAGLTSVRLTAKP
jgi:hypothetical protein